MLVIMSSLVCNLWQKRKIYINTEFSVTGWMLCVITHIRKNTKYHSDSYHRKNVNNIMKMLFRGLSEEKWLLIKDIFWTEYTDFDCNNGSFGEDEFI